MQRSCLTVCAHLSVPDRTGGQAGAKRVWMHDPRGCVACFDHDGDQIWARAVPAQTPRFVTGGYIAVRLVPPTHPAIVGTRFIAAVGAGLAAYDVEKGTELWRREPLDWNGRFAAMDFGDAPKQQLVLLSSCEVLDAATGETLIPRCAPLMPDSTCQPVVEGRVAYFNACSSAVRFWTDAGAALRHELLWDAPTDIRKRQADQNHGNHNGAHHPDRFGQSTGAFPATPVLHNGTLFVHLAEPLTIQRGHQNSMRLHTYDAATGCAVAQRYALLMNGMRTASSVAVAGGYAFLADEGSDMAYQYINFPKGVPMIAIVTAEEQPRRIAESRGLASLAPPVFAGRRMYLAGSDQVVCVERPEALGERFSEYELAALKSGFFTREIGKRPDAGFETALPAPADLAIGKGVPVVAVESARTPSQWLFAGPFFVEPAADVFAAAGGAGAIRPEAGTKVAYTATNGQNAEVAFGPIAKEAIIDVGYAKALRDSRLTGGVSFAKAAGRKYNTTCYLYAVLEFPEAAVYEVEFMSARMRGIAVHLAGKPLESGGTVRLEKGRYPLAVHAAIAACGDWEPLEWFIQFRRVPDPMPPPKPLAGPLAAGVRATVEPLPFRERFPGTAVGAWPLDDATAAAVAAAVVARPGALVGDGDSVAAGGTNAVFRPIPGNLFGDRRNARGVFCAVVEHDRDIAVRITLPKGMRCWLSGREIRDAETVPLAAGRYALLMALGAKGEADAKVLAPALQEVADPAVSRERWLARVRKNEPLLRAIAASGPKGAYAQQALDALEGAKQ
jgi:hypothetical protein